MKRLVLALLVAIAPAAAYADSDGYYCIDPGFTYWLEIVPRPIKQCEVEITSRLVERDSSRSRQACPSNLP